MALSRFHQLLLAISISVVRACTQALRIFHSDSLSLCFALDK
jgi:hypothetical protein